MGDSKLCPPNLDNVSSDSKIQVSVVNHLDTKSSCEALYSRILKLFFAGGKECLVCLGVSLFIRASVAEAANLPDARALCKGAIVFSEHNRATRTGTRPIHISRTGHHHPPFAHERRMKKISQFTRAKPVATAKSPLPAHNTKTSHPKEFLHRLSAYLAAKLSAV